MGSGGGRGLCPATPGLRCCSAALTLALGALIANNNSQVLPHCEVKMDVGMLLVSDAEIVVL